MEKEILEKIGLNEQETNVYLTLLKLGKSGATKIAKNSGINRTTVYYVLEKLKQKGLISNIVVDGKNFYESADPQVLLNQLIEKESLLRTILPKLKQLKKEKTQEFNIEVLEGKQGVKNYLEKGFKIIESEKPEEIYVIGGEEGFHKHFEFIRPELLRKSKNITDRNNIKVKWLVLGPEDWKPDGLSLGEHIGIKKFVYYKKAHKSNTIIFGKHVDIALFGTEKPIAISMNNKYIAETFKIFFDILWDIK